MNRIFSRSVLSCTARPLTARYSVRSMTMDVTFLGTSAGKPSLDRNVSSLGLRLPDGQIWIYDCGEATQHQLMRSSLKSGSITKIFITHMHGDHCYGLVPLLSSLGETVKDEENEIIDIYGPSGVRELVRTMLRLSYCRPGKHFRVHELLFQQDSSSLYLSSPSLNEAPGSSDIDQGEDGYWDVLSNKMYTVRAGPILHTIPCLGYVIQEADSPERIPQSTVDAVKANAEALKAQGEKVPMKLLSRLKEERQPITLPDGTVLQPPAMTRKGRKITILGDTYDATKMIPLAMDSDLVVHESTNAFLPDLKEKKEDTEDTVRERAASRGHSTPEVAGDFAKQTSARMLVMNHLSSRYSDPRTAADQEYAKRAIDGIEEIASVAWGGGQAVAAHDLMKVVVPTRQ